MEEKNFQQSKMNRELEQIHDVWKVVKNDGQRTINTKWISKIKDLEDGPTGEARLIVRGF